MTQIAELIRGESNADTLCRAFAMMLFVIVSMAIVYTALSLQDSLDTRELDFYSTINEQQSIGHSALIHLKESIK